MTGEEPCNIEELFDFERIVAATNLADLPDLTLVHVKDLEFVVVGVTEELPKNCVVEPPHYAVVLMRPPTSR